MPPKLSICIPTYNRGPFLDEALASVVRQATDDVEIVVSDNASTDNTQEIAARYQQIFPRLHYSRWPENMGADRNYLKVIELAHGEYCWFLGSDDALVESAITRIMPWLSGADILLLDRINMQFDMSKPINREQMHAAKPGTHFRCSQSEDLQAFFKDAKELGSMFSYISSIIIRRALWEHVSTREDFINSAWIHVTKAFDMMQEGAEIVYVGEPLVLNRTNNDSFTAAVGYTRRRLIDLDYVRIARTVFADKPEVQEGIIAVVEMYCFSWVAMLRDKRLAFLADGHEGLVLFEKAYRECFSSRRGYRAKMLVWRILPIWQVSILQRLWYFLKFVLPKM